MLHITIKHFLKARPIGIANACCLLCILMFYSVPQLFLVDYVPGGAQITVPRGAQAVILGLIPNANCAYKFDLHVQRIYFLSAKLLLQFTKVIAALVKTYIF